MVFDGGSVSVLSWKMRWYICTLRMHKAAGLRKQHVVSKKGENHNRL